MLKKKTSPSVSQAASAIIFLAVGLALGAFLQWVIFSPTSRKAHRKFYVDIGANNGDSITSFLGYPKPNGFGNMEPEGAGGGWTVWAFEMNPRHVPSLQEMQKRMLELGAAAGIELYAPAALSVAEGSVEFRHDRLGDLEGAMSIVKDALSADNGPPEVVPAMDLVQMFRAAGVSEADRVIIKLDVEGAEYEIIRHWARTGLLLLIDDLHVEFHASNPQIFGREGPAHDIAARKESAIRWLLEDMSVPGTHIHYHS